MYFYSDTEVKQPFRGGKPPNANRMWLNHYRNYLELSWMATRVEGIIDRFNIEKELKICHQKMYYWYMKPEWDLNVVTPEINLLKRQWKFSPEFPHVS